MESVGIVWTDSRRKPGAHTRCEYRGEIVARVHTNSLAQTPGATRAAAKSTTSTALR